jgi:subtilisin family serine protease
MESDAERVRGRPGWRLLIVALLGFVLATTVALAGTASPSQAGPGDGVCDIVRNLLPICPQAGGDAPTGAQGEPPATAANADTARVRRTSTVPRYDPRRLGVTFRPRTSKRTIAATLAQAGVVLERAIPAIRSYMVGVEPERAAVALASLRAEPMVERAQREVLVAALDVDPNDTNWPDQWGLRVVGFPRAWDMTRGSSDVVVAVLDTGVDPGAADLRGALVAGYDFVNSDPDPLDDEGHGTAVAGIVGARSGNREGGAGICSRCSIMPVKVLDAEGVGDTSVVAAGIVWAADRGARVINLSLGGPATTADLVAAVDYAVRHGALVVAAAGNSGVTVPFYPAAAPGAVGVAGTTQADQPYPWTNFGPWVRVAAPGCNVAPLLAGSYGIFCGTSSATPVVAGLAALAFSAQPAATPEQVGQALERVAVPLPGVVAYGRIDAPKTVSLVSPAPARASRQARLVFRGRVGPRAPTRSYAIRAGAGPLTATVAFTGAPTVELTLRTGNQAKPIARAAGPSPLRFTQTLASGPTRLTVRGVKAVTAFTLTVTYLTG